MLVNNVRHSPRTNGIFCSNSVVRPTIDRVKPLISIFPVASSFSMNPLRSYWFKTELILEENPDILLGSN